ncbi:hypothetical protein D3C77_702540 [compost metagenome]
MNRESQVEDIVEAVVIALHFIISQPVTNDDLVAFLNDVLLLSGGFFGDEEFQP